VSGYREHPEYRAHVAGVIAAPADDLPRLVLADWIEEHGDPDRANFIRVQCELAKRQPHFDAHKPGPTKQVCHERFVFVGLRQRERELLGPHAVGAYGENYYRWFVEPPELHRVQQVDLGAVVVRRGFVAEVRVNGGLLWWGGHCPRCSGEGCSTYGVAANGPCRPTVTAVGPQIVAAHPVERVEIHGTVIRSAVSRGGAVERGPCGPLWPLFFKEQPYVGRVESDDAELLVGMVSAAALRWAKGRGVEHPEGEAS
jgi:uncharacterized protein (TIGR02996 family)